MNRLQPHGDPDDLKRLTIIMFMLGIGLIVWHYVFEAPQQRALQQKAMIEQQKQDSQQLQRQALIETQQRDSARTIEEAIAQKKAIEVKSPLLKGGISLQGGRFDYMVLKHYRQTVDENSPPVLLLQPGGMINSYFVEFGWLATDKTVKVPDSNTVWGANREMLTPEQPVTLFWENGQGLRFETEIKLKDDYLFTIDQRVINRSGRDVTLLPYGFINRTFEGQASEFFILHEGPLGVLDETLSEIGYAELDDEKQRQYENAQGWLGITDKYWLTALIPHNGESFTGNFKAYKGKQNLHRYQADFLGKAQQVAAGGQGSYRSLLFAGAKQLDLLDRYSNEYNIPLFDRAVDLGWLYFLTKPLFLLLTWLYHLVGDFGLAILGMTVVVKGAMYPLANKSYIAMNEMKRLQPKLAKLKEQHGDDKMKFNQEMMKIYQQEKINPAAGCLPILVQIPVFFALYKVLFVTIEMRHANFYNLIEDLSAKDPTNIFTLFGLLDWEPLALLHLGILPILMALTMWIQQQLNPKPTDPVQAKVMAWLPVIIMIVLAGFPAGLLVYWIWSNILSIAQQMLIKHRYERRANKRAANDA